MKRELLDHLVCPVTKEPLTLEVVEEIDGQIKTGFLVSRAHRYPITKFIPRFVDADKYADSFSRQRLYVRRHFQDYVNDRSGDQLFSKSTGITIDQVSKEDLMLEVGCGYGRFLDVVNRNFDVPIVGIDLSTHSVELAQDFVGLRKNVHVVQCDLFALPFKPGTFSKIFSVGVLHHTPEPKKAFLSILPYLKTGGRVGIWLYPPEDKPSSDRWRRFTIKWDHSVLYAFCIVNQALFTWVRRLPGGWRINKIIPGCIPASNDTFWQRVLSDFDDLSPTYASNHSFDEVQKWFSSAGLSDIQRLPRATAMTGIKSA